MVGTFRIWLRELPLTCVSSTPRRSKSVRSVPSSTSVVVSGLRRLLSACPSEQPPVLKEKVAYGASKEGVLPAVPREPRRRKSVTPGTLKNDSCETRHTPDTRLNGAQR